MINLNGLEDEDEVCVIFSKGFEGKSQRS